MHRRTLLIIAVVMALSVAFALTGCTGQEEMTGEEETETETEQETDEGSGLKNLIGITAEDINLHDIYGGGSNYEFTYHDETFTAIYHYDNWCVYDSYKITDGGDMKVICQALIDEHPVHGRDYESYRTADDMVYEWKQHNMAYAILPDDNGWKRTTGNVDFDPEDQGKSLEELYESRTGEEIDLSDYKEGLKEYVRRKLETE